MTTTPIPTTKELSVEDMIVNFATDTIKSAALLHDNHYYGQMMVIIFSAIDTMGLLDAPPTQNKATGDTFKAWVRNYLLPADPALLFNDVDFWGARCGVLHTFGTASDLSNAGHARQLQYIGGDPDSELFKAFFAAVPTIDGGGKHVPVSYDAVFVAFMNATKQFATVLEQNCKTDAAYEKRLRRVLQTYYFPPK